ncbi:MAG TPA: hypothetical protein VNV66_10410, partial [Pilimelia sp.]|nr:hypothetical protein [Pilimelia sp.]
AEVPPAPPLPRPPANRLTRRKPARAVAKGLRVLRRAAGRAAATAQPMRLRTDRLNVRAVDLASGADCPVRIVGRGADRIDVRLPGAAAGPVLIGVLDAGRDRRPRTTAQLSCRVLAEPSGSPRPVAQAVERG